MVRRRPVGFRRADGTSATPSRQRRINSPPRTEKTQASRTEARNAGLAFRKQVNDNNRSRYKFNGGDRDMWSRGHDVVTTRNNGSLVNYRANIDIGGGKRRVYGNGTLVNSSKTPEQLRAQLQRIRQLSTRPNAQAHMARINRAGDAGTAAFQYKTMEQRYQQGGYNVARGQSYG